MKTLCITVSILFYLAFVTPAMAQLVIPFHGTNPGPEQVITCGDTAGGAGLISATYTKTDGTQCSTCLIVVESNSIRFTETYATVPVQNASVPSAVGIPMDAGQSKWIDSYTAAKNFKCINKTNGSAGYVRVLCYFP